MGKRLFICHASEDKVSFVKPLAEELLRRGMEVWYDEYTLRLGDSLRRQIDEGIKTCDFGVVVLSPSFFAKQWPQKELDALNARETVEARTVILPIYHEIDVKTLVSRSPMLADRIAIDSGKGVSVIADAIETAMTEKTVKQPLLTWWYTIDVVTSLSRNALNRKWDDKLKDPTYYCDYHKVPIHIVQVRDDEEQDRYLHRIYACCRALATRVIESMKVDITLTVENIEVRRRQKP